MTIERLYREKEVLKIVGVSRSTLNRWIKKKKFPPPKKIGPRAIAWPEGRLKHWIDSRD